MARPKYAAKPDANQPQDVEDLRKLKFLVLVVSQWFSVGDLLIWGYDNNLDRHNLTLWEWKTETGDLTPTQKEFIAAHPGLVHQGRCIEDVLSAYGRTQGE